MSLQTRLAALVAAIGADIKADRARISTLESGAADGFQKGVVDQNSFVLTRNSSSSVTLTAGVAWVPSGSGSLVRLVIDSPSTFSGIAPTASGNARIDQFYTDSSGIVKRFVGTQDVGVTLDNRKGAGTLPTDAVLLYDVLITSTGIAPGDFRDRRTYVIPAQPDVSPYDNLMAMPRVIQRASARLGSASNAVYGMTVEGNGMQPLGTGTASVLEAFTFIPDDYAIPGKKLQWRLRGTALVNSTTPGYSIQLLLRQLTASSGASGVNAITAATTLLSGPSVAVTSGNLHSTQLYSTWQDAPIVNTLCALAVGCSGPGNAATLVQIKSYLEIRWV